MTGKNAKMLLLKELFGVLCLIVELNCVSQRGMGHVSNALDARLTSAWNINHHGTHVHTRLNMFENGSTKLSKKVPGHDAHNAIGKHRAFRVRTAT